MRIVVIVRQTPDTEAKIKVASSGNTIDPEGIKWIVNPYDEFAIEEAIRIKEKLGGEVVLITMGPARCAEALRTGLAMGADSAVHVKDDSFAFTDPYAISKVLANEIKHIGEFNLILTGKKMIDEETGQIGIHVAEDLGIPHVAIVTKLEINPDQKKATCQKEIEGGQVILDVPLPALITCERGLNEPRYASLPGIMKAKKKPLKEVTLDSIDAGALGLTKEAFGLGGARLKTVAYRIPQIERRLKLIKGTKQDMVKNNEIVEASGELIKLLREDAKVI
ncbi:MAG: electron transfer flavoprotein subunit beta/FixA family protein [Deltaproteobacteria bacterium]|nr:electron transfer flavoprotein subunit beta/FixA family protein [Deltaproteobacteria bacterium]